MVKGLRVGRFGIQRIRLNTQAQAQIPAIRDIHCPIQGVLVRIAALFEQESALGCLTVCAVRNTEVYACIGKDGGQRRCSFIGSGYGTRIRMHTMVGKHHIVRENTCFVRTTRRQAQHP